MRAIQDIFSIWPTLADMARDLGKEYQTVAKWSQRGRIPPESWDLVIKAASRKRVAVTPGLLNRLNAPRGQTRHEARAS
jgi:hypothetical protein